MCSLFVYMCVWVYVCAHVYVYVHVCLFICALVCVCVLGNTVLVAIGSTIGSGTHFKKKIVWYIFLVLFYSSSIAVTDEDHLILCVIDCPNLQCYSDIEALEHHLLHYVIRSEKTCLFQKPKKFILLSFCIVL